MTKTTARLISVLLLCVLTVSGTALAAEEQNAEVFSPDGSVIFERDGVRITTAGLDVDPTVYEREPIIWLEIENTGDQDAYLGVTNGVINGFMSDVYLIDYYIEDGEYHGGSYAFSLTVPAGAEGRYALGGHWRSIAGSRQDTLDEMELCFTLAEDEYAWPDYTSDPVVIVTGDAVETADIDELGTVVIDNDMVKLVLGEQHYDDWSGPYVYVYAENKTDGYIGISAETADADGNSCDCVYYSTIVAPGKRSAEMMAFDSPIREMKGFEELTLAFCLYEADEESIAYGLYTQEPVALDPVTAAYAPQTWGEYENGGLRLEIQPRYNDLITVETPESDENGVLFSVSEIASLEAGGYDGAGWLFAIGRVSEDRLHELLCMDMSGAEVFARDGDGNYYIYYHPTDVRYERATPEEMERDQDQWRMLGEWAINIPDTLTDKNEGLEYFYRGNTVLDMYLARAAYDEDTRYTVSATELGPAEAEDFDAAPYAEALMDAGFFETSRDEAPDGEYVCLTFPEEDVRFDFFFAEGNLVREVRGDYETFYETWLYDEDVTFADIMQGWYYALAESAGLREADTSLDAYVGTWAEEIAGRGVVTIEKSLAPGKAMIKASWPDSAAVLYTWEMTGRLDEEAGLVYDNGVRTVTEYDESGEGWTVDESWDESGVFYPNDDGGLCWHEDISENDEDSVFVRADGAG